MNTPEIHFDVDADARLAELGLGVDCFREAIEYGVAEASACTDNDAVGYAGLTLYSRIGRRLRELLATDGWQRPLRRRQQMQVVNERWGVTIIHALGNEYTGDGTPGVIPSQRHPKGAATKAAVEHNRTENLFDGARPLEVARYRHLYWMLLYRVEEDVVLSELSLPIDFDDGRVTAWRERIILPRLDGSGLAGLDLESIPDPEQIDFPIQRRR